MESSSVAASVVAAVAALLGGGIGLVYSYFAERRRVVDADNYRNHEQRANAAVAFLGRFNTYRRDVREGRDSAKSGQDLADVLGVVALFFDEQDVVEPAKRAQCTVNNAKVAEKDDDRQRLLAEAERQRDDVMIAMKRRLEPPAPKRRESGQ